MINKVIAISLVLYCHPAFAIGDSIATTEGGLYFTIGIAVFILLCLTMVVYLCFKIAGPKQRSKWALLGGLPSLICAAIFSWQLAIVIAFGVAFYLQHTAELKGKAKLNNKKICNRLRRHVNN